MIVLVQIYSVILVIYRITTIYKNKPTIAEFKNMQE